jgi:hypothetical protein
LVSGAVQGLAPEAVVVVLHAVPMPAHSDQAGLAALGPFTVSRNSLPILRLVLAIAVTLNIALLSAVGWLWLRVRATKTDTGNVSGAA